MNAPATITGRELECLLGGHSDGTHVRVVALLVIKGHIDFRSAMRIHELKEGTLYKAKTEVEGRLVNLKSEILTNKDNGSNEFDLALGKVPSVTPFKPASKMFLD